MRLKLGRPTLDPYRDRFDVPTADGDLAVTFMGVTTLLFADADSAFITDGFFSRPSATTVVLRRLASHQGRITDALARVRIARLDAVVPVHSHYDHALDSVAVARRTAARLIGGRSVGNIGRGGGLDDSQLRIVTSGERITCGPFELTFVASTHSPPDRSPGDISAPLGQPARWRAYKCGEAWSILVEHTPSGRTALVQGSAGHGEHSLAQFHADVAYLGIGQLGLLDESYLNTYWERTVRAVGARRVVLIHWDDFTRPLTKPLLPIPYFTDDLDATMRVLTRLARDDGVILQFPTLWQREDPWRHLSCRPPARPVP